MGQEVKTLLRAQSKYGLMGSSAKTGKKIFCRSQEQFLDKTVIWDRTPPAIHQLQCICVGEGSRSQIFKQNSIILIRPKVMAFLVISLSPRGPHGLHIFPSSPNHPHHPHIIPIIPILSP